MPIRRRSVIHLSWVFGSAGSYRSAAHGALSLAIRIVVLAADFAGHLTGYQIGLSMGSLIDPQTGVRNNTIAILYANLAIIMSCSIPAIHAHASAIWRRFGFST